MLIFTLWTLYTPSNGTVAHAALRDHDRRFTVNTFKRGYLGKDESRRQNACHEFYGC